MLSVLFLAVVILGVLLFDTRERLKKLESRTRETQGLPVGERAATRAGPMARPPAVIVDRPDEQAARPPAIPAETLPEPENPPPVPTAGQSDIPVLVAKPATPAPDLPPVPAVQPRGSGQRFEDLFGRQLPIWAGGITLAVAGVLLVKYSIDAGLLSPAVRVFLGLLLGAGLIGGAEGALRADARVGDPRVRQALSGAGIATLYAAILAAADLYDLVGPATAFVGLAAVTALAMVLSIRFGPPTAILGLVGGLAAPALVGEGPPNVPLLSAYLALAIGGLTALSRRQRWMWLGVAALAGGAGWGGILILTGTLDVMTSLSLGMFLLVLGVALPWVAFTGLRAAALRTGAAVVAAAQVALLVAKGGFAPLEWGFYLLLAAALGWLAWREERFRPLPPVALTVGLLLLALWPTPATGQFAIVLLVLAAIHALPAFLRLWRPGGSMIEAGQIIGVALGGYAVTLLHHYLPDAERNDLLALLGLGIAAAPALAAGAGWTQASRRGDARFAALALASALLVAVSAFVGLAHWMPPIIVAMLGGGLVLMARAAEDRRLEQGATAFLAGSVLALLGTDSIFGEAGRLAGEAGTAPMAQAALRWGVVALATGLGAMRLRIVSRAPVSAGAALLAYGALAQFAPGWSLPVIASAGLVAMGEVRRRFVDIPALPATGSFTVIALLWAAAPLAGWTGPALFSLAGQPMLAPGLPPVADAITRLAIPAVAGLFLLLRGDFGAAGRWGRFAMILPCLLGLAAVHSIYKHLFLLGDTADVVRLGLAERTVWEWLLLGAGWAAWRLRSMPRAALIGAGAAVAHGLWYGQILYNPLVREVAVGAWPVANLLLPAFGLLFAGLWIVESLAAGWTAPFRRRLVGRMAGVVRMTLIVLFAYASLRQLFAGNLLVGTPIGPVENIGWSVLAIGLAVGFLLWGIRGGRHDWRIGSLILMLAAVAKVFLLDAAGLEGLLRIASFLALGFSLIGIGWLYSRFLRGGGVAEGQA